MAPVRLKKNEYWGRKSGCIYRGERVFLVSRGAQYKGGSAASKPLSMARLLAQQAMARGYLNGHKIARRGDKEHGLTSTNGGDYARV
jgi:hypothetical protein